MGSGPAFRALGLFGTRTQRARVLSAGSRMDRLRWGNLVLREATNWKSLVAAASVSHSDLVVLDPCLWPAQEKVARDVSQLSRRAPHVSIIAYPSHCQLAPQTWLDLRDAGVQGVIDGVMVRTPFQIAQLLRRLGPMGRTLQALRLLENQVPTWCVRMLERALGSSNRGPCGYGSGRLSVGQLTDLWVVGGSESGLRSALRRAGLPPPGWLVRWLTALRAVTLASFLDGWETVAYELGLSSRRDLRRMVKRLTGQPPTQLTVRDLITLFRSRCGVCTNLTGMKSDR